jgi:hypothetical protein
MIGAAGRDRTEVDMLVRLSLLLLLFLCAEAAVAEARCQDDLEAVEKQVSATAMPPAKETQIRALLDQVAKACKENNEVVAQVGLDQVRDILKEQQKPG